MYSLVLDIRHRPQLGAIDQAHQFVLEKMSHILSALGPKIKPAGTSDLATIRPEGSRWQKFSGNSMRMKRQHFLYHGTLLYDFDLQKIERWLASPTRTPKYRQNRQHEVFVTNLDVEKTLLVQTLLDGWQANEPMRTWSEKQTTRIVESKYTDHPKWVIHSPTD